jgi:hypothetical protein
MIEAELATRSFARQRKPSMKKLASVVSAAALASACLCYAADRFEVSAIKAVRPTLVNTLGALKKGDIAKARAAFEAYDSGWNGIEMYINTRDKAMYDELEKNLQERITKGLAAPSPDLASLTSDAQTMLAKYDEAIGNVEKAPPLNPLYDDIARLRIVRAHLREVTPALKAGEIAKARKSAAAFGGKLGSVDGLLRARSAEAAEAVAKGTGELMSALKSDNPDIAQATSLADGIMAKYNGVVTEITKEARSR